MTGQLSIFDYMKAVPEYARCVDDAGHWIKPCVYCGNWEFSKQGARCKHYDCRENSNKDFINQLEKSRADLRAFRERMKYEQG